MRNRLPVVHSLWMAIISMSGMAAWAEMPAPTTIEADGTQFPFVSVGEGAAVLFVHGAIGDYRKWDALWQDVAEGHEVMA